MTNPIDVFLYAYKCLFLLLLVFASAAAGAAAGAVVLLLSVLFVRKFDAKLASINVCEKFANKIHQFGSELGFFIYFIHIKCARLLRITNVHNELTQER